MNMVNKLCCAVFMQNIESKPYKRKHQSQLKCPPLHKSDGACKCAETFSSNSLSSYRSCVHAEVPGPLFIMFFIESGMEE